MVGRLRKQTGLVTRHVWHEDRGFRKCTILNRAIEASSSDYLVFTDGDCIPRRDFLAAHVKRAEPGHFLSGGYVRLPMDLSKRITIDDVTSGRATEQAWLMANGLRGRKHLLRLSSRPSVATLFDHLTTTRATFNGCNASAWKEAVLEVNGFDERMEYGGLDRELGERLVNAGFRPKQIRHRAICVHLDHARGYKRKDALKANRAIRLHTRRCKSVWTSYGIQKGTPVPHRRAA
jgi:GT2 family glycosyltransferase